MSRRPSVIAARVVLAAGLAVVLAACGGRDGATGAGTPVRVALTPRFQVGTESARPISRVRIVAYRAFDVEGVELDPVPLGSTEARVNAAAAEWRLSVGFPPRPDTMLVVATIELLHVPASGPAVVEWSGRTIPVAVVGREEGLVEEVSLGRGPLENLEIFDILIRLSRFSAIEGDTVAATASTFPQEAQAQPFWGSLDTAIATVTPAGSILTRRDGNVRITATAGFVADTVVLQVLQRPARIQLSVDSLVLGPNAPGGTIGATVFDVRNAPILTGTSGALTWSVADTNLVRSLGNGQFEANLRTFGRTTATAQAVFAPSVTATVPIVVR